MSSSARRVHISSAPAAARAIPISPRASTYGRVRTAGESDGCWAAWRRRASTRASRSALVMTGVSLVVMAGRLFVEPPLDLVWAVPNVPAHVQKGRPGSHVVPLIDSPHWDAYVVSEP